MDIRSFITCIISHLVSHCKCHILFLVCVAAGRGDVRCRTRSAIRVPHPVPTGGVGDGRMLSGSRHRTAFGCRQSPTPRCAYGVGHPVRRSDVRWHTCSAIRVPHPVPTGGVGDGRMLSGSRHRTAFGCRQSPTPRFAYGVGHPVGLAGWRRPVALGATARFVAREVVAARNAPSICPPRFAALARSTGSLLRRAASLGR